MLEVDDIMLDEGVIFDFIHVQNKLPWHRILSLITGEIHEMGDSLKDLRLCTVSLDGNNIGIVSENGLLIQVDFYFSELLLF